MPAAAFPGLCSVPVLQLCMRDCLPGTYADLTVGNEISCLARKPPGLLLGADAPVMMPNSARLSCCILWQKSSPFAAELVLMSDIACGAVTVPWHGQ